jgi:acetyltransferase-like isoleucine patch superfamily enzyme
LKTLFINLVLGLSSWAYYRIGWLRASLLGVKVDWNARINLKAKINGVRAIGCAQIGREATIGAGTYLGSGTVQHAVIGSYCSIGPEVMIGLTEHRLDYWTTSPYKSHDAGENFDSTNKPSRPVIVNDGVWIGARVTLLQGVTIGDSAVIAAGAVVACDVPANEMWGGIPARRIKKLESK